MSGPALSGSPDVPERHLNDVMESIPLGYFHLRLLMMCGMAFMADAMEVSLLSFIATCAGAEWGLTDTQVAAITSVVFAGQLLGSMFWGPFADKYGRRMTFLWGSGIISLFGLLSGISPNYGTLLLFRGLVGFGVGGLFVPFDILAEFLPSAHRGQYLMRINYFWTVGSMFVAALAWACLSAEGWRMVTYLTVIPVAISSALAAAYLPESPRWLIVEGRAEEAAKIVREMAAMNGVRMEPFKFHHNIPHDHAMKLTDFLSLDQIGLTLPLWGAWFSFGFCYFSVILFVTVVYDKTDGHVDELVCDFDYGPIFVTALSEVIATFLLASVIDRWGRVKCQFILFVSAGLFIILMGSSLSGTSLLIVSLLARMAASAADSAVWISTPELYPTEIRASAHSVANCMARVGAFLSPFVVESQTLSFIEIGLIVAAVNALGAASVLFLPETAGLVLVDTKEEVGELTKKHEYRPAPTFSEIVQSPLGHLPLQLSSVRSTQSY